MAAVARAARQASKSKSMAGVARFGLAARAFVYLVIGWLAVQIARGQRGPQANQRGAVADIAQHSYGLVLLWILGIGFFAYGIWRLSEAAFGTAADGRKAGPRAKSLVRGIVYIAFGVATFTFIAGASQQGQAQQQATLTARVMRHDFGRWLVGLTGAIVVIVGLGMVIEGARRKFEKELRMQELTGPTRTIVVRLGVIGTIARGIAFAVVGALVVDAAVTGNAAKSTGLDGALRTLADRAYGPWILGVVAVGLIIFGLFGFAQARWAKT